MNTFLQRLADRIATFVFDRVGFDGLLHLLVSMLICALLCNIASWYYAAIIALQVGIIKEFLDCLKPGGKFSAKDLICDAVGIALALIC